MDKIINNLYIGTAYEAIGLFKNMGEFKAVLSIGAEFVEDVIYKEYFLSAKDFHHMIIQLWDRSKNIEEAIEPAIKFIDENIKNKIFIHCYAGVSRSPAIVYAYLIHLKMRPISAFKLIKSQRPIIAPYMGFIKNILKHFFIKNNEIDKTIIYIKNYMSS